MMSDKIVPGERVGDFTLGEPAAAALERLGAHEIEKRRMVTVHRTAEMSLFISDGVVDQIGIHGSPAPGSPTTEDGVGLGTQLKNVPLELCLDACDECLVLCGQPGLTMSVNADLERVSQRSRPSLDGSL